MLFYKLPHNEKVLPRFDRYFKKAHNEMAYCFCRKCKKHKKRIIYMYNTGLENINRDNLFLCISCFGKLGGPISKIVDTTKSY